MVCPYFLIAGQNLSLLLFIIFIFKISKHISPYKYTHFIQFGTALFAVSAITTTVSVYGEGEFFSNSIGVLTNYIYWPIMLWILITIGPYLDEHIIGKSGFYGLIIMMIMYFFIPLKISGFIANHSPNSFSLVLICFTAIAVVYVQQKYNVKYGTIMLLCIVIILTIQGRRAGSILTLLSGLAALYLPSIKKQTLMTSIIVSTMVFVFYLSDIGEQIILDSSPRIHDLLYEIDKVQTEDRSYLTRVLMVEKGLDLFSQSPIIGNGLNSFTISDVEFEGDFIGSEFIINKENNNNLSAHNSYITFLAEGGLFQLLSLIFLQLFIIVNFIKNYNLRNQSENAILWGFLAMSVHLYFITGIVNVYVWYLIGLSLAICTRIYRINQLK
jgi:O-antigen ligase